MNQEEKRVIDKEVIDIIFFHLKARGIEENRENIELAFSMFLEGIKYIKEIEAKEQEKLLKGFGYKEESERYQN